MKLFFYWIALAFLPTFSLGQVDLVPYDTCTKLQSDAPFRRIARSDHNRPLIVANGIIISGSEIKANLIDTVFVSKRPRPFEKFGKIGGNGVIYLGTRQTFDTVRISTLIRNKRNNGENKRTVYAVNGFLFADPDLTISRKAIKNIDIIKNFRFTASTEVVTCISIWTITNREIREDRRMPKLCRGVGVTSGDSLQQ